MTDLIDDTTPRLGSTTPLPKIISVDDHIVEPPHLWDTWLPARYRDRGPKAERRGIGDMEHIGGGTYRQTFDPDGPQADCWVYEDLVYINKRHVAAVGFDRDDMTMSPITYDEMRPGCYEPKARIADNEANWVEAALCFPTFPRFCGQTFLEAKDKELAEACVVAYNDFMVEEWCGDSGGRLIPLCIIPLWDADKAAAEVRRNAARGVRARVLQRDPAPPRAAQHPRRYWDPFFAACEETGTVVCMHIGSSSKMPATSADAPGRRGGHAQLRQRHVVAVRLPLLRRARPLPPPRPRLLGGPDRLAALHPRAGRRRVARAPGLGRRQGHRPRAAVHLLPPPGLRLLLPRPARPRLTRASSAPTASPSRPTTPTPTPPGPTPGPWPRSWCRTSPTRTCTRSCGATPLRCSAWRAREACGSAG